MAISDYDTSPANNLAISGINVAEGCPPANINDAIRQMMADLATFNTEVNLAVDRPFAVNPSDQSITSATFVNVTGCTIDVANGDTWTFKIAVPYTAAANSQLALAVNGPATSLLKISGTTVRDNDSSVVSTHITAFDSNAGASTVPADSGTCWIEARATFTADGTFALRAARISGTTACVVKSPATIQGFKE